MDATMESLFDQHVQDVRLRLFNFSISVRHLKHVLAKLQLYNMGMYFTDFDEVVSVMRH